MNFIKDMTIKYFFIFTFLCATSLTISAKDIFSIADSLYNTGEFSRAAIEYERVIYLSSDLTVLNEAYYKKALCFKNKSDFSKALNQLLRINFFNLSDSIANKYHYESALCGYLSGDYAQTESQLMQYRYANKDTLSIRKILLLEALNYNELEKYDQAKTDFIDYFRINYPPDKAEMLIQEVQNCYSKKHLPHLKSQKKANILEFMPGLGLVYVGKPIEGSFNFLLNALCLSSGVYEIYYGYYLTGYFFGAVTLSKFYLGGQYRTKKMLIKHNYLEKKKFTDGMKLFIKNIEPLE
jgi:hypothetical protein